MRADLYNDLDDTAHAWETLAYGTYVRVAASGSELVDAQAELLDRYAAVARVPE